MARVNNGTKAYGVLPEQPGGSRTLAAMRQSFHDTRGLVAQAALGRALRSLPPNASRDQFMAAVSPVLGSTPEGQAQLMSMMGQRYAAEAMASRYGMQDATRRYVADENNQTRRDTTDTRVGAQDRRTDVTAAHYGDEAGHYANQDRASLARVGVAQGNLALRKGAASGKSAADHLKAQGEVAKLLTPGKDGTVPDVAIAQAKDLNARYGLGLPDQVIDRAKGDREVRAALVETSKYDHTDPQAQAWTSKVMGDVWQGKTFAEAAQDAGQAPVNPMPKAAGRAGGRAVDPRNEAVKSLNDMRKANAGAWPSDLRTPAQRDAFVADQVRMRTGTDPGQAGTRAGTVPGTGAGQSGTPEQATPLQPATGNTLARVAQPQPTPADLATSSGGVDPASLQPAAPAPKAAPVPAPAPAPAAAAPPPAAAPAPPTDYLGMARQAIGRGADPGAVMARLKTLGVDPSGLSPPPPPVPAPATAALPPGP